MLVVTLLRWTSQARIDPLDGVVRTEAHGAGPGEADRCALEHALRIVEHSGGRCVAVTLAGREADEMLRDAMACGADAAIRVRAPATDESSTARALAAAIEAELGTPDLVLAGDRSVDRGTGSTPAFLAAELGGAQALGLTELSWAGIRLTALRRLDGGRRERLAVPLPAVCSVEPGGVRLRRAALPSALAARDAPVHCVTVDTTQRITIRDTRAYRPRAKELPQPRASDPRQRVRALTEAVRHREPPRIVTAEPSAAAEELLSFLRGNGYLGQEGRLDE